MGLKVFKFGGASVKNNKQITNVGKILAKFDGEKLIVVVSAMGKTTNALEEVVNAFYHRQDGANALVEKIKMQHYKEIEKLVKNAQPLINEINDLFVEIDWLLEDEVQDSYDYIYDQIVSIGELASTKIVTYYLKEKGLNAVWLDIRDVIKTNEAYREAKVNWEVTQELSKSTITPLLESYDFIITQGFIGSTSENNTTTLGREGSDYTAGILSYCLDAESMHIWKDVPGILTADPDQFENVSLIDRLSYKEAVEMTYYGAKVIHPKTIKPIQNKGIPLYVRPFRDPDAHGTVITEDTGINYPPVVVIEPHQSLLNISTTDFSFVAEHHLSRLFELLAKHRMKVNMMRNTAISFTIAVNSDHQKINAFLAELENEFKVLVDKDLELITIRHYTKGILQSMRKGKVVLLEERLKETVRMVVRDVPMMTRKY